MDPVQRIPRYILMFKSMIKAMSDDHPQKSKLVQAEEIASRIALAETDDSTVRAAIMYKLAASVESFPPSLVSSGRLFIDCIDVDDIIVDISFSSDSSASLSSVQNSNNVLHCTYFLFDDKLLIVKRPNGDKSGRALAGIDDLEKIATSAVSRGTAKKSGLVFKGVFDIVEIGRAHV